MKFISFSEPLTTTDPPSSPPLTDSNEDKVSDR